MNMHKSHNTAAVGAVVLLVFLAAVPHAGAQTTQAAPNTEAIEWPQFAKDLRRFDVIAFGLFPFAYLVTSIGYDLYRSSQHGWDSDYYPWPLNERGIGWTSEDYRNVLIGTAVVSLTVAAVDLTIVLLKRHAAGKREEARSRPETEIRTTPLYEQ
jgi:hypothetical protein